jgi:hypothetical protein
MLPLVFTDFVNRHDVGMIEVAGGLGLSVKALDIFR